MALNWKDNNIERCLNNLGYKAVGLSDISYIS